VDEAEAIRQVRPWLRGLWATLGVGAASTIGLLIRAHALADDAIPRFAFWPYDVFTVVLIELSLALAWLFVWLVASRGGRDTLRHARRDDKLGAIVGAMIAAAAVMYGTSWMLTRVDHVEVHTDRTAVIRNILGLDIGGGECTVTVHARAHTERRPFTYYLLEFVCPSGSLASFPLESKEKNAILEALRSDR
jgi:hypothetical protein